MNSVSLHTVWMFNRAITVEIIYCSENEAISRVMLMLHRPNVPVSVVQEVFERMRPRATFAVGKHALSKCIHLKGWKILFSGIFCPFKVANFCGHFRIIKICANL